MGNINLDPAPAENQDGDFSQVYDTGQKTRQDSLPEEQHRVAITDGGLCARQAVNSFLSSRRSVNGRKRAVNTAFRERARHLRAPSSVALSSHL